MNEITVKNIYGQRFLCSCGKTHRIDPQQIFYSENAMMNLGEALSAYTRGKRAAVIMDLRTREAAGKEASQTLEHAGWKVCEYIIPDPFPGSTPVCDDQTHDILMRQMEEVDIVLPVGSGVLSDLGKWVAYDLGLPFVCFATAASMNGYTSANVAATIKGMKGLLRARPPKAVFSSPSVLSQAPYELTTAGLGDVLAKSASSADWRMNHVLFGDHFCERAVSLVSEIESLYLDHPEDIRDRKPEAMEALFHSLLLTGVAMTMAESSAPASGGEHLISHTLDTMSFLDGHPHDLHGRQVGIGTILCSEIYRRLLAIESPVFNQGISSIERDFWGMLADSVGKEYGEKMPRIHQAKEILSKGDAWDNLRGEIHLYLRPAEEIKLCLKRAGGAFRAEDIGCSRERLLSALLHAHEFRSRFTCLDIARMIGLLPRAASEVIEACL